MRSDPDARNVVFAALSDVIDDSYRRLDKEETEHFEDIILNLLAVLSLNTLYTQTSPLQIADILILPPGFAVTCRLEFCHLWPDWLNFLQVIGSNSKAHFSLAY